MGKRMRNMKDRLLVGILSLAMLLTGVTVPAGTRKAQAAEAKLLAGVSITVKTITPNPDWSEHQLSITNGTSVAISNFVVKIPVTSGKAENVQAWGVFGKTSPSYSDGAIIIHFSGTINAGATFNGTSDDKFGFGGGGATFGTAQAYEDDGSDTSANKLNYEITGKPKGNVAFKDTPFGKHGKLQLKKVDAYPAPVIVDAQGQPYQLRGASTHGMQWFPEFVNEDAFRVLRDEWGVNMVRLASYVTQYNGYTTGGQSILDAKIVEGVEAAKKLGLYVIIDWHIHDENPNNTKAAAREFFKKYAAQYKDYDNVIFEVCNEPTNTPWYNGSDQDIYNYANEMCGIIRDAGSDAIIVCGTNTWSQDVHEVKGHTIEYDNIMYTFHFYSGTHGEDLRRRVQSVSEDGLPIFITEFGICASSGNGGYDTANADKWIGLCDKYNISFACWSFCNKSESASYLLPSCNKTKGGWLAEDLTETGIWLVNTYRAHQDKENNTDTSKGEATPKPSSSVKPSATPKPSSSVKPSATPTSSSSAKPSATPSSSATAAPSATPTSSSSAKPSATPSSSATVAPSATPTSSSSAKPSVTPVPSVTPDPGVTQKPGTSVGPNRTSSPGYTTKPGGTLGGNTPSPMQTPGGDHPSPSQTPGENPKVSTAPDVTTPPDSTNDPYISPGPQNSAKPGTGNTTGVITDVSLAISSAWSGVDAALAEQAIVSQTSDKDIAGSVFGTLKLRATKTSKNSVTLKWNTVAGANKYIVYGNRCGKNNTMQKLATVTGSNWTHKGLKKGTYYKYLVTACQTVDGIDVTLGISKTVHTATLGSKKGNAKKITLKKSKVTLKKGKSFKIKAKQVPLKKKNKIAKHRKISYESSNQSIATVSSSGKIKAKKKGKCTIYVYAQNGSYKQIKVTVK